MTMLKMLLASAILPFFGSAQAMTFSVAPPVIYLGGVVVASDWDAWQEAMLRFGTQIDTVVLYESPGGHSAAGRNIGGDIRKRGLRTVVHGRCSSACANMFLGGSTRQFALTEGKITGVLGFHGSYRRSKYSQHSMSLARPRGPDYFLQMTDGKMDAEFVERFIRLENSQGLMRFFHPAQRGTPNEPLVVLCLGDEDRWKLNEQCERIADVDALSKGVVTTWGVYELAPPPALGRDGVTIKSWERLLPTPADAVPR